jgi:hypothetical protein
MATPTNTTVPDPPTNDLFDPQWLDDDLSDREIAAIEDLGADHNVMADLCVSKREAVIQYLERADVPKTPSHSAWAECLIAHPVEPGPTNPRLIQLRDMLDHMINHGGNEALKRTTDLQKVREEEAKKLQQHEYAKVDGYSGVLKPIGNTFETFTGFDESNPVDVVDEMPVELKTATLEEERDSVGPVGGSCQLVASVSLLDHATNGDSRSLSVEPRSTSATSESTGQATTISGPWIRTTSTPSSKVSARASCAPASPTVSSSP